MTNLGVIGEQEIIEDVGAGKGHLSTVHLINLPEYGGDVIVKVPGTELAKQILSIQDERIQAMHNTEIEIYTLLKLHPDQKIAHPKTFYLEKKDSVQKGFIVMEYLDNISHVYISDNLKPDDLIEPLKHLARLHALGLKLSDEEKQKVPRKLAKDWFSDLFSDKNIQLFMGAWKTMIEHMPSSESKDAVELLPEILKSEQFEKLDKDCLSFGIEQVICHGDFSSSNLLFEKLPDDSLKFKAICDFQISNWGNGAQDLTRLFTTALSGSDRRENLERLMKVYYDELIKVTNGNAPFSWDQLAESYNRFFPTDAAIVCITTAGRFLRNLAEFEGVKLEKYRNVMLEKYVALMEDLNLNWNSQKTQ